MVVAPCASTTEVTDRTSTIDRVDDARRRDGELAVAVGHEGRVLEDGLLAAAARALEEDLRVRVVGHDRPAAGLDLGRAERELVGDRLRNLLDALRAERVVGVDEEDAAGGAAVLRRELGLDAQR